LKRGVVQRPFTSVASREDRLRSLATAVVANDVAVLKETIDAAEAHKVRFDRGTLKDLQDHERVPVLLDLPCSLLDLAAATGSMEVFKYLVSFCEFVPRAATMSAAIISGSIEMIRGTWDRLSASEQERSAMTFAVEAVRQHQPAALRLLLPLLDLKERNDIVAQAAWFKCAGAIVAVSETGFDFRASGGGVPEAMYLWELMREFDFRQI
jgi:hypothetical protein